MSVRTYVDSHCENYYLATHPLRAVNITDWIFDNNW